MTNITQIVPSNITEVIAQNVTVIAQNVTEAIAENVTNVTDTVLGQIDASDVIASQWSHYFIFGTALFGLFWGTVQIFQVSQLILSS